MRKLILFVLALLTPALLLAQANANPDQEAPPESPGLPAIAAPAVAPTGGLDPASILKPLGADWPTYSGDYTGKRYSSLKTINRGNVQDLSLAWVTRFTAGTGANGSGGNATGFFLPGRGGGGAAPTIVAGLGTGQYNNSSARFSGSPLEVNGVIYLSSTNNAWAVDARTGQTLWHFYWKTRGGTQTSSKGMAMWHNYLYMEVNDCYMVSLDAATGKLRWQIPIASFKLQYFTVSAPLVVGDHVIAGVGDDLGEPGYIQSFDPVTGARQWIHYNVPMKKGDPGLDTWPSLYAARHGGGTAWTMGAYDAATHIYYYGTGNPIPGYTPKARQGKDLYTDSLIALNVDTGKMVWGYSTSPNDAHDWDSTETPIIVDGTFNGKPRKLIMQALRNGYYFVWDRTTGEHLVTAKLNPDVNWATGLNSKGQPDLDPEQGNTVPGSWVNADVTNYPPPSFSPQTGLFYVEENDSLRISYLMDTNPQGSMGLGGVSGGPGFSYGSNIEAVNYHTGKAAWLHPISGSGGLLTTAGGLLFSKDGPYLVALNSLTGKTLWHTNIGQGGSGPETFELDGKQYVLAIGGDQVFCFVLNRPAARAAAASR